jgi:hypothetical protein
VIAPSVRATRTVDLPVSTSNASWAHWAEQQQRTVLAEAVPLVGRPPSRVGYTVDQDARTFTVTLTWDAVPQEA